MRTAYHEQLSRNYPSVSRDIASIAMERAATLLQADRAGRSKVISDHEKIATLSARAEESASFFWHVAGTGRR